MAKKNKQNQNRGNCSNERANYAYMPAVRQGYPITPSVSVDCYKCREDEECTQGDYQPAKAHDTNKLRNKKRAKNVVFGMIMCLLSVFMLVPHILAGVGGNQLEMIPINIVPDKFNAIGNIIVFAKTSIAEGFSLDLLLALVPSLIIAVGILFILINTIKSVFAVCAGKKAVSYTVCAFIYMVCIVIVFILAAIGIERLGLYPRISIVNEIYYCWNTSELTSMLGLSVIYFLLSAILSFVSRDRQGY